MQIPSSFTSLISSWLPNLWDTETKAKNKQAPDLCKFSLTQVLHIYKQQELCPAKTENEGSASLFIRELEQNSFQQKQLTGSIFNHINSMTENLKQISGRVDQLEPVFLEKVLPTCVLFFIFSISVNLFLWRKVKGLQAEQTSASDKNLNKLKTDLEAKFEADLNKLKADLENGLNRGVNQLQGTFSELKASQNTKNEEFVTALNELSTSATDDRGRISAQSTRIDGISAQIRGVQNDLAKTKGQISIIKDKVLGMEDKLPEPNLDLENTQAVQLSLLSTQITKLQDTLAALEISQKEFASTATEIDNATVEEIDNLKETCHMLGSFMQNMLKQSGGQAAPTFQATADDGQLMNAQLLEQQMEKISLPRSRRSSWGSWGGSQPSLNSQGSPAGSPPKQ
ncbi:MAG: hypothetical protein ON057_000641 [Glomeribacter sp. 1016415]|nr:hypothetical protein [Glomeribacter sp. 1016415]